MSPIDHSAEYYWLREGHERALALAARSEDQRDEHLAMADHYEELARRGAVSVERGRPGTALQADQTPPQ